MTAQNELVKRLRKYASWCLEGEQKDDLLKAAAEIERQSAGGWIPVSERLPDPQRMVLLHSPQSQRGNVQYGFYGFTGESKPGERDWFVTVSGGWELATYTGKPVTHWMSLPNPPLAAGGRDVTREAGNG